LYNDQRNSLFLIYSSICFCLICFGISFSPSSEAGVQFRQWFKSAGYGVTWLMRRSNRAFLSSHSLSKLHLVYVSGLNLITYICTLIDDNWKITRSGVALPKFLISVFSARVKCEIWCPTNTLLCSSCLSYNCNYSRTWL
jgi:hypothetical protein